VLIRQLFDKESFTYSYLVADPRSGEAMFIDPVVEHVAGYLQLLKELGLTLKYAADTHCHADHITALGELRERTGCATLAGEQSEMACVSQFFKDDELIKLGGVALKAIYTPGHTDDSYCFYLDGPQPVLFSGDTLLIRGTGRTDFQNGSSESLFNSLHNKLLVFDEKTAVLPGHDYKGWTQSTLKEEKRWNPRLQAATWQDLDQLLKELKLLSPKLMDTAIPANKQCGRVD
jgi:glyoxylase-like metal-dependent hydrolase (beta-lactamase superfamily II)